MDWSTVWSRYLQQKHFMLQMCRYRNVSVKKISQTLNSLSKELCFQQEINFEVQEQKLFGSIKNQNACFCERIGKKIT